VKKKRKRLRRSSDL
jgi:hypothetical protein